jgi:2',3'-cyclic-nucleotide 2'-phosphodiesterase (5'-nucleotidase family)
MLSALLFAAAVTTMPALPQLNTTPALGTIPPEVPFTFFVAGDNRPDKGDAPSAGFTALIAAMQKATPAPAFVLWGGDTIKGKKSKDAATQYPLVLPYFAKLGVPVFNVPGNHELDKKGSGDCNDAPDPSGNLLTAYTAAMSSQPYGYFQYGNSAFIGINTEDSLGSVALPTGCFHGFVSPTQFSQLQATLAWLQIQKVQNIFVFMHRPVRDDNSHQMQPDPVDKNTAYGKQLIGFTSYINSLANPSVAYVFASHDHRYYQAAGGSVGTPGFVVTGGAGAPLSGCPKKPQDGAYYHYLKVEVSGTTVLVTVVPLTNMTLCGAPPSS